jgi:hypothetical protein
MRVCIPFALFFHELIGRTGTYVGILEASDAPITDDVYIAGHPHAYSRKGYHWHPGLC